MLSLELPVLVVMCPVILLHFPVIAIELHQTANNTEPDQGTGFAIRATRLNERSTEGFSRGPGGSVRRAEGSDRGTWISGRGGAQRETGGGEGSGGLFFVKL